MLYINSKCVEAYNETGETPSYITDHEGNRAFHLVWHDTDGWRGYYEAKPVKKYGWEKIDYEGWCGGHWEDTPEDARDDVIDSKLKKLAKEYAHKGYDVEAVFVLTSNVFSTAFDVFVKKS